MANLEVGFNLTKGWITPVIRTARRSPVNGEGGVVSGPPCIWRPGAGSTAPRPRLTDVSSPRRNRELE
jgi:hypothetical protein